MGPGRPQSAPPRRRAHLPSAPQGELPLSAIHINLEEKEKQIRSFLIEGGRPAGGEGVGGAGGGRVRGRGSAGPGAHSVCAPGPLINTIRVLCASYEDYSHWLLCLQALSPGGGAPQVRPERSGAQRVGCADGGLATQLTAPGPRPGPGRWPRLALLRWTDQLGLGVPSTPL